MKCTRQPEINRLDGSSIEHATLDQKVRTLMTAAGVTGLAISVFETGQQPYQKAFGYANFETGDTLTPEHVFYAASFSKAVFGYLVAQLVEEGQLHLDRPLASYLDIPLSEIPVEKAFRSLSPLRGDERLQDITARMCLNHTTGLPNWRWIEDDQQLKFLYPPGSRYHYSGEGIMILQWVVEYVMGKPLEELAQERIFDPLHMVQTRYLWDRNLGEPAYGHRRDQRPFPPDFETEDASAAGSLVTTLADYQIFANHLLDLASQKSPITNQLFAPSVRIRSKRQFGPLSREDTSAYDDIELSYGMGWGLLTTPYGPGTFKEGHDAGFQHYAILFPQQRKGIILMTNSDNGESIFKDLLEIAIADTFTPWSWENYIPYQHK